ncbi:MAG: YihA family ribosome biogenesis GTP-binding protein [Mycoplasma sp.]|nr:YihA family ribosome biogenesis GTP-binding protein [Mycoplasma sp.]
MWEFIKSASNKSNWLVHDNKEICFIGRSNVGKSSLINALANNKLAKTSKTPGRTQLINYFKNENNTIIVDLPGYGFANIALQLQEKMFLMVDEYFNNSNPNIVFLLIDARRGIMRQDENIIEHLINLKHNIVLILTKVDKAKQSEIASSLKHKYFKTIPYFESSIKNENKINKIKEFIKNI